ncbi:MAG TPA: hypothetical protein VEX88_03475 [Glaciibacter sp.]|nr:hypothetical protein [Glaciibacter sp.]
MNGPATTETAALVETRRDRRRHRTSPVASRRTAFRRPERTIKTAKANQSALGGRHLGIGIMLSGAVSIVFLLWRFAIQWTEYSSPALSLIAWLILLGFIGLALVTVRRSALAVPPWLFPATLSVSAIVAALDLAGCWMNSASGVYPTAAAAVGALLAAFIIVRETRDILVATGVLATAMVGVALAKEREWMLTLAPDILITGLAVIPPLLGVFIVSSFRRMVQLELDLVLVQSTVSQPRFAVGMLASEELARLDLDAEQLLDDVAEGRIQLPLAPESSNRASSLATQLRLHLIEGRTETWLHHAVTESEFLAPAVRLHDPSGLAGLLSPEQRDALLLTIWLLVGDAARAAATVSLTLGPISPSRGVTADRRVRFPIELTTTGVPQRRVDPETWQAIRVVGPYTDSVRDGSLRVDIECSVDNPADA